MDNVEETLRKLKSLQELQNVKDLTERLGELEAVVSALIPKIQELSSALAVLQMDFHKQQSKITTQNPIYKD